MWGQIAGAAAGSITSALTDKLFGGGNKMNMKNAYKQLEVTNNATRTHFEALREGAIRGGYHPLAALGQTPQFNPTFTAGSGPSGGLSDMGQNIGRAVRAGITGESRQQARMNELAVERGELENEKLRSEIALQNSSQLPPPMPSPISNGSIPGQGDHFRVKPSESLASGRSNPAAQAGAVNSYSFARTSTGYVPVRSKDIAERLEDDTLGNLDWHIRNRLVPFYRGLTPPSTADYPLPKGATYWKWSPRHQEFRAYYPRGK